MTIARAQADIEAVRIAEVYSSEQLLKNFPVPRMRLSNVEINIPMMVSNIDDLLKAEEPAKIDTGTIVRISEDIIKSELQKKNITLTNNENAKIKRNVKAKSDDVKGIRERAISMQQISGEITKEIYTQLSQISKVKSVLKETEIRSLTNNINLRIKEELILKRARPARIRIEPLTSQLREVGKPENLVTMKISISEDALEMTRVEQEGEERDILIPE